MITFLHLRHSHLYSNTHDSVFVIKVLLQRVEQMMIDLEPEIQVRDPGQSMRGLVHREEVAEEFKDGDGLVLPTCDIALAGTFNDKEREVSINWREEPQPIQRGGGQWSSSEGDVVSQ